jgi:hypothetical protein
VLVGKIQRPCFSPAFHLLRHSVVSAGFADRCPWWSYQVARTRLIVGLITPHRIYLTIMKPVREAKARSRSMLCMYIQGDRKVTQPILKYSLVVAVQYNLIGLINTVSLWLYKKSPRRWRHVLTCSRQSVSCLQTVEVEGCLFHKCNTCSLSNTTWHLILTKLARMSLEIHFPVLLCQTNRHYLAWWTVSVTQEACRMETFRSTFGVKWR